jgi:polyisoprenoid-binding protein YceI
MVSNVRGVFTEYSGSIYSDGDDFLQAEIDLTINPASISTGDATRDSHLKSADFFDVEQFSKIQFKGTSMEGIGVNEYLLQGELSIRGITKTIRLDVEFNGIAKDPWGNKKAAFEITGKINRKDFGLTWNTALDNGGVMLGDEVTINGEIQLVQQRES